MTKELDLINQQGMEHLGDILGQNLKGGEVIELVGPLGAGKTTLAKAILKGAGVKTSGFSPTFILNATFTVPGRGRLKEIHHLDLYRLKNESELTTLGLYDIMGRPNTATIIEWADRFPVKSLKDKITIEISPQKDGRRLVKITDDENIWQNIFNNPATLGL